MRPARIHSIALAVLLIWGAAACTKSPPPPSAAVSPPRHADAGSPMAAEASQGIHLCEHGVPADLCTRCIPELVDVFKAQGDWCEEHQVPESHCRTCNPALTFTAPASTPKDWCQEHAVPESQCTKCHPQLIARFIEAGDYCREHGFPESVCPHCHPERVKAAGATPPVFPPPGMRVRLASEETAREAGLVTQRVEERHLARTLEVVGQLAFNHNRHAPLSARGDVLVLKVHADVGDEVKEGQPLAEVASASVGEDQGRLLAAQARVSAARAALAREQSLVQRGISARQDMEQAQTELASAEGAMAAARAALSAAGAGSASAQGQYTLRAPLSGTVVSRDAVPGQHVAAGQTLLHVADLSTLWAQLDIPEADALSVRAGQKVTLHFEGIPGETREATLTRVGASVDPATRTVRARVELPNPDHALKAGLFLRGRIQISEARAAWVVPRQAIQRAEGRFLVFVKKEVGLYEPVAVELGTETPEQVEVVKGLMPGAEVVTTGAFLLKTEILKDSIGAGCCEEGGE
ncbi:efflux RND transporter periplasmic adaptor subunit [Stigmatella aurantiaca]|uniref:Heavy metal resistance protein CzcB n=1 Tax=Stigmatella aurantiaca (strain DW4/3-1) TaxID=378806 RepID=Q09BI9_STIAD|nr:efflux RND transporter periplasmic adaptor subunit [Stigmatella aurantiaca]ADO69004.1 Heavy metal resistance protein CzcB [Stigmatella aurantiaca DW4/3-1]EAU69048.1 heavy metal resistance protein CzcB [Stigmatella aurantiaca DW4/3-1]